MGNELAFMSPVPQEKIAKGSAHADEITSTCTGWLYLTGAGAVILQFQTSACTNSLGRMMMAIVRPHSNEMWFARTCFGWVPYAQLEAYETRRMMGYRSLGQLK